MRHVHTITDQDIGQGMIYVGGKARPVSDFMGRILAQDVGKQIHERDGVLQVENEEQRRKRIAAQVSPHPWTVGRQSRDQHGIYDSLSRLIAVTVGSASTGDNRLGSPSTPEANKKNAALMAQAPEMRRLLQEAHRRLTIIGEYGVFENTALLKDLGRTLDATRSPLDELQGAAS